MKIHISVVITILFSSMCFGQGPDLEGVWYLHSYEYDPSNIIEIQDITPPISPTIIFDKNYFYSGIVCNEYGGQFFYNETEDLFTSEFYGPCLCGTCNNPPPSHVEVENDYFDIFLTYVTFSYSLEFDQVAEENVLKLEPTPGTILTYRDTSPYLGVSEISQNTIKLFPNPANNFLTIISSNLAIEKGTIYSMTGKEVQTIMNFKEKLDISNLSNGMYFIEFITKQGKTVRKFIKK